MTQPTPLFWPHVRNATRSLLVFGTIAAAPIHAALVDPLATSKPGEPAPELPGTLAFTTTAVGSGSTVMTITTGVVAAGPDMPAPPALVVPRRPPEVQG